MPLLALLLFCRVQLLHADQPGEFYFETLPDGTPHFTQVLRWEADPNVLYYEVTLQNSAGETVSVSRLEEAVLKLNLSPGAYRYRIVLYNLLRRPEVTLPWQDIEILRAETPHIDGSTPKMWFLEDFKPTLTLSGEHLMAGATVVLKRDAAPSESLTATASPGEGTSTANVTFPAGTLSEGEYSLVVTNPGGLSFNLPHALLVRHMLPAASGLEPATGSVFGPEELRGMRSIRFSWKPVPEAVHYTFRLYRADGAEPVVSVDSLADASYLLEDLTVLERGDFSWTVEAVGRDEERGAVPAVGAAKSVFRIELPPLVAPTVKGGDTFYGR